MVIAIKKFIREKFEPFKKHLEPLYRLYDNILYFYKGIKRSIKIEVDHAEKIACENLKKIPPYIRDLIVRTSKTPEYAKFVFFSTEMYVMTTCMALTTSINAVALVIIYTLFGFYVTYSELLFLFFIINACPLATNISLVVFPYIKSRVVKYSGYCKYMPHAFEQYKPELNKGIDFLVNSINARYVLIFIDKFKELLKGYPSLKGPKKTDRVPLLSGKYIYFSFLLTFILVTTLAYIYANVLFPVFIVTNMLLIMPLLILWQTFVFLYKNNRVSKYTTSNQKFWKRSLFIFWAIEVYLFLIIVFLYINSPENTRVGVNHSVLLRKSVFTEGYANYTLLMSGILVIIYSFFVFSKKSSTGILKPLLLILGFGASISLLQEEFFQVIFALNKSSSLEAKISAMNFDNKIPGEVLGLEKTMREDLVVNHFTVLLVFLKFWHVVFIVVFIVFKQIRYIEYNKISYDSSSAMLYNSSFLVWFNALIFIIEKKKLMYYFLLKPSTYYIYQDSIKGFLEVIKYIIDIICS